MAGCCSSKISNNQVLGKGTDYKDGKESSGLNGPINNHVWDEKSTQCMSVRFYNKQIDGFKTDPRSYEIFRNDSIGLDDDEPALMHKCTNPQAPEKNSSSNVLRGMSIDSPASKNDQIKKITPGIIPASIVEKKQLPSSKELIINKPPSIQSSKEALQNFGPEIFVSLKSAKFEQFYELGQQTLGRGAYGKVVTATHRSTGIKRAVKCIKKKGVLKSDEDKLFAEASLLREIDHPNIMKLYELYQDTDHYYLITEYLEGGELFDKLRSLETFTEDQAAECMRQIFSALTYLHEKKIMHRDLKPENLLLDSKKNDANIKLIDFGTAQRFQSGVKATKRVGTPYYIAPEVLRKSYDEKCDLWSCGVILYILLSGKPPFNGRSDVEIFNRIKIGKFSFDYPEWKSVSQNAKDLISKLLVMNPDERISAESALKHAWLQKAVKKTPLNKKILKNLTEFHAQSQLKRSIMTLITTQISSQKDKEQLHKVFQQLDKDANGTLQLEELVEGYTKVFGEKETNKKEIAKMFGMIDTNNSGSIDYSEFITAAMDKEKLFSAKAIQQAFATFDQNGDGYISREEFATIMGNIDIPEDEWKKIISEADTNGDGLISSEEFTYYLMKSVSKVKKPISGSLNKLKVSK